MTLDIGYALSSILLLSIFFATLIAQLRAKHFHPWLYWLVILSTSTAGTTLSDFLDRTLELGYASGALLLISLLAAVLIAWRVTLGSLSVERIDNPLAECFYWCAILVSNTLGTALGDYLADDSGLGFLGGALLISSTIAITALLYRFTSLSRVGLFWVAFVLTRPLGATLGDLLTKTPAKGGLGFGTWGSSAVLLAVLVVLILWTSRRPQPGTHT